MKNEMSLEQAREFAELADRIASKLKTINDDGNDLCELYKQTGPIVDNLTVINEDGNNLEDLLEKTNNIVSNLRKINDSAA